MTFSNFDHETSNIFLNYSRFRKILMNISSPDCSAIAVELSYIFSTMWGRETYTLYGVIAIVFCILIVVS